LLLAIDVAQGQFAVDALAEFELLRRWLLGCGLRLRLRLLRGVLLRGVLRKSCCCEGEERERGEECVHWRFVRW